MNRTYEAFAVLTIAVTGLFVAAQMGLDERPTRGARAPRLARASASLSSAPRAVRPATVSATADQQLACCAAGRLDYASGCGADRATGESYAEPAFTSPQVLPLALPLVRLREEVLLAPVAATGYDAAYDLALGAAAEEGDQPLQQFGPAVRRQAGRLSSTEWRRLHGQVSAWREQVLALADSLIAGRRALDRHPLEWLAGWLPLTAGEVQVDGLSPAEISAALQMDGRRSAERQPSRPSGGAAIRRLPTAPAGR